MEQSVMVRGAVLAAQPTHSAGVQHWSADDGDVTIAATCSVGAPEGRRWQVALYLHRDTPRGRIMEIVALGEGPTRDVAEQRMSAQLAELVGLAAVPGKKRVA